MARLHPRPARSLPLAALLTALLAGPPPALPGPVERAGTRQRLWGEGETLRLLPFTQSHPRPLRRSHLELLIRPDDRPTPLDALLLEWPDRFDGRVLAESVRLCRMVTRPQVAVTRCAEVLPARVDEVGPGRLRIVPARPLDGEVVHGVSLLLFNPSLEGLYPVRLRSGGVAPVYVGTWLLPIETEGE